MAASTSTHAGRTSEDDAQSYGDRLSDLADASALQDALVHIDETGQTIRLGWADLEQQSGRVGHLLANRGVGPGSRVMVREGNSWLHPVICIAIWRIGGCILPVGAMTTDEELAEVAVNFVPDVVISERDVFLAADVRIVSRPELVDSLDAPAPARPDAAIPELSLVLASGGSSGQRKLIINSRTWGYRQADVARMQALGFGSGQRTLIVGPLYHTSPFSWLHSSLLAGNTTVVAARFDIERTLDAIETHRISFFPTVPTVLSRLLKSPTLPSRDLSTLTAVYHTGAACPPSVKQAWIDLVGAEQVFESYGSTENLGPSRIRGDAWLTHRGSVGVPTVETRIIADDGTECGLGEVGRIFQRASKVKRTRVMRRGIPTPLSESHDEFETVGDYGRLDEEGYLYLSDRRLDMIVSGGANIYPAEVEAVLAEHPAVSDVIVVGLPDEDWGSRVHAVVELKPSAEWNPSQLTSFARERLSPYKVPKSLNRVEQVPRNEAGKAQRAQLRDALIAAANGDGATR